MELFDNHCHYNDDKFDGERDKIINEVYNSGVTKLISAGYSLESSIQNIELTKKYDFIYTISGISPNDIPGSIQDEDLENKTEEEIQIEFEKSLEIVDNQLKEIEKVVLDNKKIVGIGEIGLDYYWNKKNKELQKLVFIKQIQLANKLGLPIVIHTRDAIMDTLEIIKNVEPVIKKGVFHCCPLNTELIKEALKLGFYISFAGPITFKNSKNAKEVVGLVPVDKILIETDSPYLAPEPVRGTRNDSRNVKFIAEKIAEFKGLQPDEIAKATYENANKIFGIF